MDTVIWFIVDTLLKIEKLLAILQPEKTNEFFGS